MSFFTWSEEYVIGVEPSDRQHERLFGIMCELQAAIAEGRSTPDVSSLIACLKDYTITHFTQEENLMLHCQFPLLRQHQTEHAVFVKKIVVFAERCTQGDQAMSLELLSFLRNWLLHHILKIDRAYVPYVVGKQIAQIPQG